MKIGLVFCILSAALLISFSTCNAQRLSPWHKRRLKVKIFYKGELLQNVESLKVESQPRESIEFVNDTICSYRWKRFTFVDWVSLSDTVNYEKLYRFVIRKYKVTWGDGKEIEFEVKIRRPKVLFRKCQYGFLRIPLPFGIGHRKKIKIE